MANKEHLRVLRQGVDVWNKWRDEDPNLYPDLRTAKLQGFNLQNVNFKYADLQWTELEEANVSNADLFHADLFEAQWIGADLRRTNLSFANLADANFTRSDLQHANLSYAQLVNTKLENANLDSCRVFGASAWCLALEGANQKNLVITKADEPTITVDNIEVAQFVYLLLNNERIRDVIDTVGKKAVLILGRFTPERKVVLDAIREQLRSRNYLPMLFDFEKPTSRNLTETISTLAHISRFVIADITLAKSIPQELQRIIPDLPSLPVQPIILSSEYQYAMFEDFLNYPWVLLPFRYESTEVLLASLEVNVITPAIKKAEEIMQRRMR